MRTILTSFVAFAVLAIAGMTTIGPASADPYFRAAAVAGDVSASWPDDFGYAAEIGITNGTLAGGIEFSDYRDGGESYRAVSANAYVYPFDWTIRPYGMVGAGYAFDPDDPLLQAGGGLLWLANESADAGSFGIFAGYRHRWLDGDDAGGSVEAGIQLTF